MDKWKAQLCYNYDPEIGEPDGGIAPARFRDLRMTGFARNVCCKDMYERQ